MTDQELLVLKDKVQRYLTDIVGRIEIDSDGDFTLRQGSSRMFVSCGKLGEERTYVGIRVPLLFGCTPTPELFRHIATHADDYVFGHVSAHEREEGVDVHLSHQLLGDYLDAEELKGAVIVVAMIADELDDELQATFGGTRFHEDDDE